jgi:PAS domain S-box-containing protein
MLKQQTKFKPHVETLYKGEDVFNLFLSHAPASIAMFDTEMRCLAVSKRWIEDYPISISEIIGVSHYKAYPETPAEWKEVHRRGLAGEIIRSDEERFVRADGTIKWVKWEVFPWRTNKGEIGGIIIFSENITLRKESENKILNLNASLKKNLHELSTHQIELEMQNESLRKSQNALEATRDRYYNLYEFASVSYITLSQSGQILEINLTGTALLGLERNKLLQRRFDEFVVPDNINHWYHFFLRSINSFESQSIELQMRKMDGTICYVHLVSRLVMTEDGKSELQLTLADTTEQKKRERAKLQFELLLSMLTRRERDVLSLALTGIHNKDISIYLNINIRTVENHRASIHRKTGVDSLLELAQIAAGAGVLFTPTPRKI